MTLEESIQGFRLRAAGCGADRQCQCDVSALRDLAHVVLWVDDRRVIAVALAWPPCGPQFVSDVLRRDGLVMALVTVWRLLRRHQFGTRRARLALCETYPVSRKIPEFACQLRRRDAAAQHAVLQ